MAESSIDLNRGVIMRVMPKTGVNVYMYRDEPGVWRNAYGSEVAIELAKECGFDVERYSKIKIKKERMAQAMSLIEAELDTEQTKRVVFKELNGFKAIDIGLDRYTVEDPDGNSLTPSPLPKETALKLLSQLTKPVEPEAPKEAARPGIEVVEPVEVEATPSLKGDGNRGMQVKPSAKKTAKK